jgi:peptidoglycan/xylan/chitin deacetylase (PgdA/CDA1 family)
MTVFNTSTLRVGVQPVVAAYIGTSLIYGGNALDPSELIEAFDSLTGFAAGNGGLLSIVDGVEGAGQLQIAAPGASSAPHATKATWITDTDPAELGVIAVYREFDADPEYQTCTGIDVRLGRGGTYYTQAGVTVPAINESGTGGRWDSFHISEAPTVAALGAGALSLRAQTAHVAPYCQSPKIDALLSNAKGVPTVILTFDDIRPTQYSTVFPLMQARGFRGTLYIPTGLIGAADRLTLAQIQEMYSAGWDAALDGTADDTPMTGKPTVAGVVAEMESMRDYLASEGMTRGAEHFCYPNGSTRTPGTKVQVASVTSDGGPVVTMASTTGVLAGYKAAGYQVPVGTTVVSVDSGTQLTLSANVPTQTKPMSFTNVSGEFHTGKLQSALKAAGFKTGRMTNNGTLYSRYGVADRGLLLPGNSGSAATASSLQTWVDQAKLRGNTAMFYFHDIKNPTVSGLDMLTTEFVAFLDALKTAQDAGELRVMTASQWWARDCADPATPP